MATHPLYREMADELEVPLEEDALADILGDPALKADAIHPNAAGYAQLADALRALLRQSGALN